MWCILTRRHNDIYLLSVNDTSCYFSFPVMVYCVIVDFKWHVVGLLMVYHTIEQLVSQYKTLDAFMGEYTALSIFF